MTSFYRINLATMKFLAIFAIPLFAVGTYAQAVDGSFWCIAKRGAHCVLPGVGPTYTCGKTYGGTGYESAAGKKFWRHLNDWDGFAACCHASNKGACHN